MRVLTGTRTSSADGRPEVKSSSLVLAAILMTFLAGCADESKPSDPASRSSGFLTCTESPSTIFEATAMRGERGAEEIDAPPNAALREFLRRPEVKRADVPKNGWIQLTNDLNASLFGLAGSELPLDLVVRAEKIRSTGKWKVEGGVPCWPMHVVNNRMPIRLYVPTPEFVKGASSSDPLDLVLMASVPGCAAEPVTLSAKESDRAVIVNASISTSEEAFTQGPCAPENKNHKVEVSLERPMGRRVVLQGNFSPPREVRTIDAGHFPEIDSIDRRD